MNYCDSCHTPFEEVRKDLTWQSTYVGAITLPDVNYGICPSCGELLLPYETAELMDAAEDRKRDELLSSYPVEEFVIQRDAAQLVGSSKQAFSKNRRIQRGFIYAIERFGTKLYLRESVELFAKTGDGRFNLGKRVKATRIIPPWTIAAAMRAAKPQHVWQSTAMPPSTWQSACRDSGSAESAQDGTPPEGLAAA